MVSGWWSAGEISETSEQKNSRAPILLSLYIGYVNAETLTLFGCGTAGKFGTGNTLLRYGIGTRCAEQPPTVRDAFSEAFGAQNRLLWYGRDIRYRKHPPTVRNEATGCGHCVDSSDLRICHCVDSSDPRMRPLRSGLWVEGATTAGVIPALAQRCGYYRWSLF